MNVTSNCHGEGFRSHLRMSAWRDEHTVTVVVSRYRYCYRFKTSLSSASVPLTVILYVKAFMILIYFKM